MIPQELLDMLNDAQGELDNAKVQDAEHELAVEALNEAIEDEAREKDDTLVAHQVANEKANAAITAIKAHFGIV